MRLLLSAAARTVLLVAALAGGAQAQRSDLPPAPVQAPTPSGLESGGGVEAGPGHGAFEVRLSVFDVGDDRDGNPFLDESLTVIEPIVLYQWAGSEETSYSAQLSYDNVTSASIERLSEYPDQSGASGDNYIGLDLGVNHALSERTDLGGIFSASVEYDYRSLGLGGSFARTNASGSSTLSTSLSVFYDELDVIRFNGIEEGTDERISANGVVQWYQTLSRKTHGELGLSIAHQTGFLETPYNAVVVEDPNNPLDPNAFIGGPADIANFGLNLVNESLPDDRLRTSLYGRVRTLVGPTTALELGARLYDDDWGVTGISLEPSWFQELGSSLLRVRYRYYDQGESDYFSSQFTSAPTFRTQDSDLGEFDSHTFGLSYQWPMGSHTVWDVGADTIFRSDGLDQVVVTVGWRRTY